MLTYLGNANLKREFLAQITQHEQHDALIKGTYGLMNGSFKGCAVGCALHSLNVLQGKTNELEHTDSHARYETELGLPIWLAYLVDHVFEAIPLDLAKTWPRRFADAVPVGAIVDDVVLAKILRWSLADEQFGVRSATDNATIRGHIDGVIAGFDAEIATSGHASVDQREAAAMAARAASTAWEAWAARAAWEAWEARAARAAWAAREARAARAAWAARAAREARAASTAWEAWAAEAFYPALSEFVIQTVARLEPARIQ